MLWQNKNLIAIDIGSSCVKLIELAGGRQKSLKAMGIKLIPQGMVRAGAIENPLELGMLIRDLANECGVNFKGRRASIGLSGTSVFIKREMKENSKDEVGLNSQVKYDLEQQFQLGIDEIYWHYHKDTQFSMPDGRFPLITAAAKQDVLQQHVAAVKSSGIKIGVVDCSALSLVNLMEYTYGLLPELTAILNIGGHSTQVIFTLGGQYFYHRDLPFGGDHYTDQIASALGIDKNKAETLKISAAKMRGEAPLELMKVLEEVNEEIIRDLDSTIDFFFSSAEVPAELTKIQSFLLTGGGCRILGLDAAIARKYNSSVSVLNPFQNVKVNNKNFDPDYILNNGHIYASALGLALRVMS